MTARLWLLGRRSSTRILVIVLAAAIPGAALARGAAPKSGHTAPAAAPAPVTDANDPLRVVKVLADPKLEGRGVGTAGLDSAGVFIAREMGQAGLSAAGELGSWFQSFEVTTGVVAEPPCELKINGTTAKCTFSRLTNLPRGAVIARPPFQPAWVCGRTRWP